MFSPERAACLLLPRTSIGLWRSPWRESKAHLQCKDLWEGPELWHRQSWSEVARFGTEKSRRHPRSQDRFPSSNHLKNKQKVWNAVLNGCKAIDNDHWKFVRTTHHSMHFLAEQVSQSFLPRCIDYHTKTALLRCNNSRENWNARGHHYVYSNLHSYLHMWMHDMLIWLYGQIMIDTVGNIFAHPHITDRWPSFVTHPFSFKRFSSAIFFGGTKRHEKCFIQLPRHLSRM